MKPFRTAIPSYQLAHFYHPPVRPPTANNLEHVPALKPADFGSHSTLLVAHAELMNHIPPCRLIKAMTPLPK